MAAGFGSGDGPQRPCREEYVPDRQGFEKISTRDCDTARVQRNSCTQIPLRRVETGQQAPAPDRGPVPKGSPEALARVAVGLAWVYTALGENDEAIRGLETGYDRRDPWMIWLKVEPRFDALRGHPVLTIC